MGNQQKSRHLISYQDSGVGIQEIIFIYSPLPSLGSSRFCVISLTYYMIDRSLCPLCLEWFPPLPRQQDYILEYILPTKSKRVKYPREYQRLKNLRVQLLFC
ncbi:MAG: hypothetical protein DWQ56_03545 [Microcystis aeruginosa DA14]|uniref:Uncharacterized protein n=1 Tax=Microcystis aeruginosa DA14 TaxID=1987506 RepID=A0A3E0MKI4_MICAE|nr:MAG: hypothetical protein DWQ56_03545 [Microcystis aeruginosa DA14]